MTSPCRSPGRPGSKDSDEEFIVVFCAMGITAEEYNYFRSDDLERTGALENAVLFVNLRMTQPWNGSSRRGSPSQPLSTSRSRRTTTSSSSTDMTNYCDALRQIGLCHVRRSSSPRVPRIHVRTLPCSTSVLA